MDAAGVVLQLTLVGAAVMVFSGVAKLAEPATARRMLRSLKLPSSDLLVRGIGLLEVLGGAAAIMFGGAVAGLVVSGAYLAFAAWSDSRSVAASRAAGASVSDRRPHR